MAQLLMLEASFDLNHLYFGPVFVFWLILHLQVLSFWYQSITVSGIKNKGLGARLSLHFICYPYFGPVLCFVYIEFSYGWLMAGHFTFGLVWFGPSSILFCFIFIFFKPAFFGWLITVSVFYLFFFIFFKIFFSGGILNKSLFMQVEIAKNLLLFGETIIILFI